LIFNPRITDDNLIETAVSKDCIIIKDNIIRFQKTPKFKVEYCEGCILSTDDKLYLMEPFEINCLENTLGDFLRQCV